MMRVLRQAVRAVSFGAGGAFGLGVTALTADAPTADHGDGTYDHRKQPTRFPSWVHDLGRFPTVALATLVAKVYLGQLNSFKKYDVEILEKHLENRPEGASVITVSNHTATVDDPAVIACMLPWKCALPWNARWSLCSQEYSYLKGKIASTVFFSAKTLPIKRGAGIDHRMLEDIFDKVQDGEWVHIFPEGKIEQNELLGGRPSPARERVGSRLKWGVGKLIARADVRPIVIPFYHTNMQKIMPQDENNQVISMIPQTNIPIGVRVGQPINFDDLFEKYASHRVAASDAPSWETQEQERALYAAITRRIEDAMLELAVQCQQDQQENK